MSLRLQSMNNGKELLVVDVIVSFSRDKQLGEIGAWVPFIIGIGLEEDGT